ncbi:hypothetical protein UFOVP1290_343 [uncultured Caudovirales phage]|uniref:Uncharacterized protein n=1 Tax=uncultured Caudovirales phage TaxID=2100421 RepID=A0A6J5RHG9_9CAUD|nr:hypothetical protein UFOVP1290_343 [uncultured Caudovirales phage]
MLNICDTDKEELVSGLEPQKPEPNKKRFKIKTLGSVGERACHFPNSDNETYEDDETPELNGIFPDRQSFSLAEALNLTKKLNLDPKDVHITASFVDDYLYIEVMHISELNYDQQLEQYNSNLEKYNARIEEDNKRRLEYVSRQIKDLKQQEELLKKKVK